MAKRKLRKSVYIFGKHISNVNPPKMCDSKTHNIMICFERLERPGRIRISESDSQIN